MTERDVALANAIAALKKFSQRQITRDALLIVIDKLEAIKPAHKRLRS
jgi:hypothetical protein